MRKNLFSTDTKIDVLFYFDGELNYAKPVELSWDNQSFRLGPVSSWYETNHKGVRQHHYVLSDINGEYIFRLCIETNNLTWQLEAADPLRVPSEIESSVPAGLIGAAA